MAVEIDPEIEEFVQQWCAVDGETGEPLATRFQFRVGANLRDARRVGGGIEISDDPEKMIRAVASRLRAARAAGERKVYLEVINGKGEDAKHALDTLTLEGDPHAMRELVESEGDGKLATAHAVVVRGLLAELRHSNEVARQVVGECVELVAEAAASHREIAVRGELGWQQGLTESIKALAPTLQSTAPALLAVYLAHSEGDESPREAQTPAGRLRQKAVMLERAAMALVAEALSPQTAAALAQDQNLRMELGGRLGQMMSAAQQAFGQILGMGGGSSGPAAAA